MISGVDPFGRTIALSRAVWHTHVLTQRPWMAGHEESVTRTIVAPSWINHDVDYEDRECFYAEHALPDFPHLLIKVVVQFDDAANGRVITVYPLISPQTAKDLGGAHMANIVSPHHHLDLPPVESLDRHRIDVFYDAGLDELSILFYGREQPSDVDPINDVLVALRDMGSDMVVGVVFRWFLKQVILDLPESRIFFADATILTGHHALDPSSNGSGHPSGSIPRPAPPCGR